ncbi:MAG: PAS domain-containing protein, partial [Alphaproteobacteria bacterium]|nr:PAS domain-containing protein [Alphaproteobacteria bacterium]
MSSNEAPRSASALHERDYVLEAALASIGDAVIVTDERGQVAFLNPVAEELSGWPIAEAKRQPLTGLFRIVNERTRAVVPNPVEKVL